MNPKRLLIVSNNMSRPSFRQRIEMYLPFLNSDGIQTDVYQLPKKKCDRWKLLRSARQYDGVLLHKKCLNWVDAKILRRSSRTIIYDVDDAVMYSPHRPDSDRSSHMRLFKRTAAMVDTIIAGNGYLAEHAERYCSNVHILPTGLAIKPYQDARAKRTDDHGMIRLVWIGSRSTLAYLQEICPFIDEAARSHGNLRLRVIADEFPLTQTVELETRQWSLERQACDLAECDIGLAPLPEDRFTRGKCGFKILQYFAAGLPVIASPVGVNRDLIEQSGAGVSAASPDQWQTVLQEMLRQPAAWKQQGQKASQFVQSYDIPLLAGQFCRLVRQSLDEAC